MGRYLLGIGVKKEIWTNTGGFSGALGTISAMGKENGPRGVSKESVTSYWVALPAQTSVSFSTVPVTLSGAAGE